jgi:hypothetical protein
MEAERRFLLEQSESVSPTRAQPAASHWVERGPQNPIPSSMTQNRF